MPVLINVYATTRALEPLDFPHTIRGQRDRTNPDLAEHLQGFVGFVTRGAEREMTQSLYHVARHIQRVRHHLSLEVEERDLKSMEPWARGANAILLWPDGAVRDPAGAVLVDPDTGASQASSVIPYPADALERKKRNEEKLGALGIPVGSSLPPVGGLAEVSLRPAQDVAGRALALFVVAARAGSLRQEDPMAVAEFRQRVPQAFEALCPAEQAFLDDPDPAQQAIVDHAWRYEALVVLLWALGHCDELPMPTRLCDVGKIAAKITCADRDQFVHGAELRPPQQVLDALDFHVRLHWAAREANRQGTPIPAGLDPGVLQERHVALNWLVRFEDAPWDEVDTPT